MDTPVPPAPPVATPPPAVTPSSPAPQPIKRPIPLKPLLIALGVLVTLTGIATLVPWNQLRRPDPTQPDEITEEPTTAPQDTTPVSPQEGPTPIPSTEVKTHVSSQYGFLFSYPAQWYKYPAANPLNEPSFSNQEVQGISQLGPNGVWLRVSVSLNNKFDLEYLDTLFAQKPNTTVTSAKSNTTKVTNLIVSGLPAVKYAVENNPGGGSDYSFDIIYSIKNGKNIYSLDFVSKTQEGARQNEPIFDQVAKSFSVRIPTPTFAYNRISGWNEFISKTGYTIQYPTTYSLSGNEKAESDVCAAYFNNSAGGLITAKVLPYNGEPRKQVFFSVYPTLENNSYSKTVEETTLQGYSATIFEVGPIGESGSGSYVVLTNKENALVLGWEQVAQKSSSFQNFIKGMRIHGPFDRNQCGN